MSPDTNRSTQVGSTQMRAKSRGKSRTKYAHTDLAEQSPQFAYKTAYNFNNQGRSTSIKNPNKSTPMDIEKSQNV